MLQLVFYVPESDLEKVKQAVFEAGAGRLGDYEQCCWQTLGTGQFKPLLGAQPHLGSVGELERVAEYRVELLCPDAVIESVVAALKQAHPYEVPAYSVSARLPF